MTHAPSDQTGDLTGRVVLVTGGGGGLGSALCTAFARAGAVVAINYRSSLANAEAVQKEIETLGGRALSVQADVSKSEEVAAMIAKVEAELGPIEILVNNAGGASRLDVDEVSETDFDEVYETNLKSAFLCSQAVIPSMRERQWGRLINISSLAAQTGGALMSPAYCASKAGLHGLAHYYAARLAKEGITANSVCPALVETPAFARLDLSPKLIPIGRFGTPEEHANLVVHVAGNAYITGQTISLNGGAYAT